MKHKRLALCLMALILAALPLTAAAQQVDHNRKGSISVALESADPDHPMAGAELSVYYVATVTQNPGETMRYIYTKDFEKCGFPLDDPALKQKLKDFVSANTVACRTMVADFQGKASCTELPLGLYFVMQKGELNGFAACTPFLVTLPLKTNSGYEYDVNASPKTDVVRITDITIKKVWNTGSTTGTPTSVSIQLLRDGNLVETATLNKNNNWQITYTDMPESDGYSVLETEVPKGYTATYSRNGYVFTVTNTPSLAQTGQVVWPIPVFAMAGILFLMAGFVILRKTGKQDA